MFKRRNQTIMLLLVLVALIVLSGCAGTIKAIENTGMTTKVKMSDAVMLDPMNLEKNRSIYVRVANTSEMQELAFAQMLKDQLTSKGFKIVQNPSEAGYMIQAQVLYMSHVKDGSMTADAAAAGGAGGMLFGSSIGSGFRGNAGASLVGGIIGSVGGALIGKLVHVDTFLGVVDVQIKEKVEGGVSGTTTADVKTGSATTTHTTRAIQSDYIEYRTRIAASATQTNIDKVQAAAVLSDKLATQISGLF